jgi:hypothetical protein
MGQSVVQLSSLAKLKVFLSSTTAIATLCETVPANLRPMSLPPALSTETRMAALEKAAEVRRARAELKDRLKMGSVSLQEVLDAAAHDEMIGKTKMLTVLESLPGLGKVKARRLLDEIGIADTRRVRGLGDNQRRRLLESVN